MAKKTQAKETPLMKQYNAIKKKHPGAMLLFRVGDFYETFGSDAIKASKILDIVLTKRANGAASHIELAGFPHHALDVYLPKLVRSGERVAICDQLEDPKTVKGIVKRGVTELVTPGLSFNDTVLDKKSNNYLAAVHFGKDSIGIAFLDVSTGEFMAASGSADYAQKLIQGFHPSEILYRKDSKKEFYKLFSDDQNIFSLDDWIFTLDFAYEKLITHFKTSSLKGFGIEGMDEAIISAGCILYYLEETEHKDVEHISTISRIDEKKYVWLDKFTIRNLELIFPQQESGIPLIQILDRTVTPMGARMLKKWMVLPLKYISDINLRLEIVKAFSSNEEFHELVLNELRHIHDLERLISKVAVGRINPRELLQLKKALKFILPIKKLCSKIKSEPLNRMADQLNNCEVLIEKIEKELSDEPPLLTNQGGMIKDGIDKELDEYRAMAYSGKEVLMKIRKREIEKTGISSLKIAFNRVFGYYLEVSNLHKDKVPGEWIRKQTLVNAERYITEELKVYEEKILHAEEKLFAIEFQLFQEMVNATTEYMQQIQENARIIGQLDCLVSFATVAQENGYVQPEIDDSLVIDIKDGRHPVIEKQLPIGESYIPNDVFLDNDHQQIMIITGPNMSGKSALLRQTALIVLMAQMGSFVPASYAKIGVVDKVFTRVGASDNLSMGESTFMVEMTETASILNNLSDQSLVLMDEIGRGTSTYDGVSIAWAITEYLHNNPHNRPKTLFATHYHELNQLSVDLPRVKNFNVSVKEIGNKILFMRKLVEGGSEHSFGIHVAQLAGMPNPVVLRANEIMKFLEKDHEHREEKKKFEKISDQVQMSLFEPDKRFLEIQEMFGQIDINTISPVEALLKLNEIKIQLEKNAEKAGT